MMDSVAVNTQVPARKKRIFVAENFSPDAWEVIEPYFNNLLQREINSVTDLHQWLNDWNEIETVLSENMRWIYVRTTIDTSDEKAKEAQRNLYQNIYPKLSPLDNALKKKFIACPFTNQLDEQKYFTTIRKIKNEIALFREANIPLQSEMNIKQTEFDRISGAQSITYKGNELTLQQASVYYKSNDRQEREEIFKLISNRNLQDKEALDKLLSELIQLRHQIALNAGFNNYLEFRFAELGRFDYTPEDCLQFHASVQEVIMPLVNSIWKKKKENLGLDMLRPWDLFVDDSGKPPLKPFSGTDEMVEKTVSCFNQLDQYFGERIEIMKRMNYLDLDSRMHKGPGGYNMTMPEIGVPFIFMNSANSEHDLITMVHEGGHAIHTFLAHDLEFYTFKDVTSEIAEVASMGMELMSMEHWDIFYSNADDLKRAKKNHLQYILSVLTKTCLGDAFQFWLYSNPQHTIEERRNKWAELQKKFTPNSIDYSGYENVAETGYQRILHFYVVPFYYIEYAFAQLGALALWKNFKSDAPSTVQKYKQALSLGYTKPIPVFYETASAKFDFSKPYISGLVSFLETEIGKL